jgi:hypothetical protein
MKKIVLAAFAASMAFATPSFAAPNPDSNGVGKNCFGQGRSDYASSDQPAGSVGSIVSQRAQAPSTNPDYPNNNVQQNKEYKTACQAAAQG